MLALDSPLQRRLKALIAFRVAFVTLLLGSFFVFQIGYGIFPYPSSVLYIIIGLYALSIIYAFVLYRVPEFQHAYVQHLLDAVGAMLLIVATGGIESWFSWLLLVIVMSAAMIINQRAAYVVATFIALTYGTVIDLQYYEVLAIPYYSNLVEKDFLYKIFSHIVGVYLMAFFTGQLAARLERKDIDLLELAKFNREVIENIPSGLFTTDRDGLIQIFNRAAEGITGYSLESAVGRDIVEIFPFLRGLEPRRYQDVETTLKGGPRIIGLKLSTMRDVGNNVLGYVGIFEDLTEMAALSREVKRKEGLAAVGELSAKIAHEIRNPLASLKGSMEILREGNISAEKRDRLMSIAIGEMDRLNLKITDFLSYARPLPAEMQLFDLHQALDDTLEMLENRGAHGVTIHRNYKGPLSVYADQKKLKEVFWNLGINALDALAGIKGGSLSVSTSLEGGTVTISFADTGPGVKAADMERIFYPFFTTKAHGTGLGLSSAYRVVEEHGGRLVVESSEGAGATFRVIIPRKDEQGKV